MFNKSFWTALLLNFVGQDLKNALWSGLSLQKHDFHVNWYLDVYGWVTFESNFTSLFTQWYVNTYYTLWGFMGHVYSRRTCIYTSYTPPPMIMVLCFAAPNSTRGLRSQARVNRKWRGECSVWYSSRSSNKTLWTYKGVTIWLLWGWFFWSEIVVVFWWSQSITETDSRTCELAP